MVPIILAVLAFLVIARVVKSPAAALDQATATPQATPVNVIGMNNPLQAHSGYLGYKGPNVPGNPYGVATTTPTRQSPKTLLEWFQQGIPVFSLTDYATPNNPGLAGSLPSPGVSPFTHSASSGSGPNPPASSVPRTRRYLYGREGRGYDKAFPVSYGRQ